MVDRQTCAIKGIKGNPEPGTIKRATNCSTYIRQSRLVVELRGVADSQHGSQSVSEDAPPPQPTRKLTTTHVFRIVHANDKLNVLPISTAKEQKRRRPSFASAERERRGSEWHAATTMVGSTSFSLYLAPQRARLRPCLEKER